MKYLLNFEDLTEDFSTYLESEDFELENFTDEMIDDLDESDELYEEKKLGVTESLRKKSQASGIPMGILRKVFAKEIREVISL
jgi:hypothetical protein